MCVSTTRILLSTRVKIYAHSFKIILYAPYYARSVCRGCIKDTRGNVQAYVQYK